MATRYSDVGSAVVEGEYENAFDGDVVDYSAVVAGNAATYELAVAENPAYSALGARQMVYDDKTVLDPVQLRVVEAVGSSGTDEGEYLQTSGAAEHLYGAPAPPQAGSDGTYHYVEPDALFDKSVPKDATEERSSCVRKWTIATLILMVAVGLGVVSLVLVSGQDSPGPSTSASTGSVSSIPIGMVAPFVLGSCPQGWVRLDGRRVNRIPGAAATLQVSSGTQLPDIETARRFVRPSNGEVLPGTVEEDGVNPAGLHTEDVSVWGSSSKRITYISDPEGTDGLLFLDKSPAQLEGGEAETRPKSVALLHCVKIN